MAYNNQDILGVMDICKKNQQSALATTINGSFATSQKKQNTFIKSFVRPGVQTADHNGRDTSRTKRHDQTVRGHVESASRVDAYGTDSGNQEISQPKLRQRDIITIQYNERHENSRDSRGAITDSKYAGRPD